MSKCTLGFSCTLLFILIGSLAKAQDWANLDNYKSDNKELGLPSANENRVVFMGNSITEGWSRASPKFFEGKHYINRGISGQTTAQMLVRFRQDVIKLKPSVVVILAGTNDIAGNTGPVTLEMILDNIISMTELAKSNGIKVILCSVLPAFDYPWSPGKQPFDKIPRLNEMIRNYAEDNQLIYLDYFSKMADERMGLKEEYSSDGVHPNNAGYKIMEPLVDDALERVMR